MQLVLNKCYRVTDADPLPLLQWENNELESEGEDPPGVFFHFHQRTVGANI